MKTKRLIGRKIYTIFSALMIVILLIVVFPNKAVIAGGGGYPSGMQLRITLTGCKNSVITNLKYVVLGTDQNGRPASAVINTKKSFLLNSVYFLRGKWWKSAYFMTYATGKVIMGPYRGETFTISKFGTWMPIKPYRYPNNHIIDAKIANLCPAGY